MKISCITVILEPHYCFPSERQLRVEVITNFKRYTTVRTIPEDDFGARFDYYIELAKSEIKQIVKEHQTCPP